ncbi:MAG: 16S rRNA (uracil(1498)-N(3))-methyltransferase [Nitrospirae bacterium]|nr:16S rRNA (uracil(1498)-N(3))-methyltransferase [Nitrospirota bacterium]
MRIILKKEEIKGNRITLSGEKARYLISVLRCRAGDELQVFDGEGSLYKSKIAGIENKKIVIDLLEQISLNAESPLNLTLVQGILKGEKMDVVVQKATELGVKEIIPAITERSQIRHTRKVDRWRKIAEEASKQSGRTIVPVVHEPMEFNSLLAQDVIARSEIPHLSLRDSQSETKQSQNRFGTGAAIFKGVIASPEPALSDKTRLLRSARNDKSEGARNDTRETIKGFIFWEEGGLPLKEAIKQSAVSIQHSENSQLFVLVGPEGGFSKEEVSLAVSKGLITVSLGKRILRAETAAISAVALIQFLLGDI